jgi:hypothetical protein
VIFADGRPARWDSLVILGDHWYWPMELACSALGASLVWDPLGFAGEIRLDTLACRFVVGGEVFHCGERAVQLSAPILYLTNRLLLPLSFVPRVVVACLSDRFVFLPDSLVLAQRPRGPTCSGMRIQLVRDRTYLRWDLTREPQVTLWTDGAARLIVDLPGVFVDPLACPSPEPRAGTCLQSVRPYAGGTQFVFRVASSVVGWRTQWQSDRNEFRVILSSLPDDLGRWKAYKHWPRDLPGPRAIHDGQVVLVLPQIAGRLPQGVSHPDDESAHGFARTLGERIATALEGLGLSVVIVTDPGPTSRSSWTAAVNSHGGFACVCLRPDFVGPAVAQGYRVVSAAAVSGGLSPLSLEEMARDASRDGEQHADQPGFRRWAAISPTHGRAAEMLSWMIALHLQAAVPSVSVRRQCWPSAPLRGLDMPGVILYVGSLGEGTSFPDGDDRLALERVAEAVALSLEAFALRLAEEPDPRAR